MSLLYQSESSHIVDYELYRLPDIDFVLRGPYWPFDGDVPTISFAGAAQTFGTFVKYPFANLLGDMCSAQVLNLGRGGAGPGFYCNAPNVVRRINQSSACVVQVMSVRSSAENRYMKTLEGLASVVLNFGPHKDETMPGERAFGLLAKALDRPSFVEVVLETRENFIRQYEALAAMITVPKILLFVGKNPPLPDAKENEGSGRVQDMIGSHPHMVTKSVFERISAFFDSSLMVHGSEGFDSRLVNRLNGRYCSIKRSETYTVSKHDAYIPPFLHAKTAVTLFDVVNPLVNGMLSNRVARQSDKS
jgi:hypothetical protein